MDNGNVFENNLTYLISQHVTNCWGESGKGCGIMPMEVKKITLKDIAQASGYSLVSVHRALNNKEGVSKAVKQEILNVANEMGYTANYVASALKRRRPASTQT